jgi:death-on-curing protein
MKKTQYLTLKEVLELHLLLIERFGGTSGIRDLGLLASALERPKTGYYDSLCEQAVALTQSLVANHAFLDGNKRIGALSLIVFLAINGYQIKMSNDELVAFIINEIITKRASVKDLAKIIESKIIRNSR